MEKFNCIYLYSVNSQQAIAGDSTADKTNPVQVKTVPDSNPSKAASADEPRQCSVATLRNKCSCLDAKTAPPEYLGLFCLNIRAGLCNNVFKMGTNVNMANIHD